MGGRALRSRICAVGQVDGLLFFLEFAQHGGEAGAFAGDVVAFLEGGARGHIHGGGGVGGGGEVTVAGLGGTCGNGEVAQHSVEVLRVGAGVWHGEAGHETRCVAGGGGVLWGSCGVWCGLPEGFLANVVC